MSRLQNAVQQLKPKNQPILDNADRVLRLLPLSERVDTTATAAITELFPALAFNNKFKPSNIEDFKKFLYKLGDLKKNVTKTFVTDSNRLAGIKIIEKLAILPESLVKTKLQNAIGITRFLYDLHSSKPIQQVVWGYREKPKGVPNNHAGDIFVYYRNKNILGISLKAGTASSKEPLLNSYVLTQYKAIKRENDVKKLEDALWTSVYSKIPGVSDVANKNNYMSNKNEIRQLYLDYFLENQKQADELYAEMLKISRQQFCKSVNSLSLEEFKEWLMVHFNLQKKKEKVPLILVKAVGSTAEQKGDSLAQILPLIDDFKAYLNTSSVQEWLIDVFTPDEKKTMRMAIRSDSGDRAGKKVSQLGRLGKFTMLKLQYSGIK